MRFPDGWGAAFDYDAVTNAHVRDGMAWMKPPQTVLLAIFPAP